MVLVQGQLQIERRKRKTRPNSNKRKPKSMQPSLTLISSSKQALEVAKDCSDSEQQLAIALHPRRRERIEGG